ncbi:dCTP deaminase [Candidatus Thorarchaeota archaeon]|nr:MAG: dCTP deaminase [Candidatus Thorarchaeota archaeon]
MMLADRDILRAIKEQEIKIQPFARENVGPCSVDLTLDSVFRVYGPGEPVDVRDDRDLDRDTKIVNTGEKPFMILPGQFILGQTREQISISARYAALLEGRSSIARLGVIVHSAGLVNPGTGVEKPGNLTLEIYCENLSPVLLYPGMRIVQVMFVRLSSDASVQYDSRQGSRYVGQGEPNIR